MAKSKTRGMTALVRRGEHPGIALVLGLLFLPFAPALAETDARAGLIDSVADGLGSHWTINTNGPEATVETVSAPEHPVRTGTHSIRHSLGPGAENYRAEYTGIKTGIGSEYWYGWSLYFPEGYRMDRWGTIVSQWHRWPANPANPARLPGGGGGAHLVLGRGDVLDFTLHFEGETPTSAEAARFTVAQRARLGVWHDFVMHVRWTGDRDGFLRLWHREADGEYRLAVDHEGATWWNNEDSGPFFKAGMYTHREAENAGYLYSDGYRLGGADAGFEAVRP